uniref:Uncharacterized protein n=1 Tax=Nelumbo nucifera TaxID=4432 RepID=A0A822XRT3_NELNU|nr:TPA_asm: hypothetical protein HUJ06_022958 [Nelumbo nucifera]
MEKERKGGDGENRGIVGDNGRKVRKGRGFVLPPPCSCRRRKKVKSALGLIENHG